MSALWEAPRGVYREYLLSNIGSQGCLKCSNELISWNGPRDYNEFGLEKE